MKLLAMYWGPQPACQLRCRKQSPFTVPGEALCIWRGPTNAVCGSKWKIIRALSFPTSLALSSHRQPLCPSACLLRALHFHHHLIIPPSPPLTVTRLLIPSIHPHLTLRLLHTGGHIHTSTLFPPPPLLSPHSLSTDCETAQRDHRPPITAPLSARADLCTTPHTSTHTPSYKPRSTDDQPSLLSSP